MNVKNLTTAALLVFVILCVVVLAARALRPEPAGGDSDPASSPLAANVQGRKLIVYYFHGDLRCPTCESIEAYAQDAVKTGFAEQLQDGRIEWRVVNYDAPPNEHFRKDFDLVASSVVLVNVIDGQQHDWKILDAVWTLVGDRKAFVEYVQGEVRAVLEAR
jgi:hypothetical protein